MKRFITIENTDGRRYIFPMSFINLKLDRKKSKKRITTRDFYVFIRLMLDKCWVEASESFKVKPKGDFGNYTYPFKVTDKVVNFSGDYLEMVDGWSITEESISVFKPIGKTFNNIVCIDDGIQYVLKEKGYRVLKFGSILD